MRGRLFVFMLAALLIGSLTAAANWQSVEIGFYNLSEFEELSGTAVPAYSDSPILADRVAEGLLPPVAERLPAEPLVQVPWSEIGAYGGTLRYSELNINADWYLRHINNVHLIQQPANPSFDLYGVIGAPTQPGVLDHFEMNEDGTVFTGRIREGLRWSDGVPVTTADIHYRIHDEYLNKEVHEVLPDWLNWGGIQTELEIVDDYTFRFVFGTPYGSFINNTLQAWHGRWARIITPAHYMKQFHVDYADWDRLHELMQQQGFEEREEWGRFYATPAGMFGVDFIGTPDSVGFTGVDMHPTLDPYVVIQDLGNGDWLLERNPYFFMVDPEGQQLPYIDRLRRTYVSDQEMMNLNIISGSTDVQGFGLSVEDYPLYARHQASMGYNLLALPAWQDHLIVYPISMNHEDPVIEELLRDPRFRQALSLALDREHMKESMFLGFGRPAQVAPRPGTPFYEDGMEEAFAEYDPDRARQLLDEAGMIDQNGDGWRQLPDGRNFVMPFDFFVITAASVPSAELAQRYWEDVGIRVDVRQVDIGYWFQMQAADQTVATTWWLAGSGFYHPGNWFWNIGRGWEAWMNSDGELGKEPPSVGKQLLNAKFRLEAAADDDTRMEAAREIWELQSEWLFIIGTVMAPLVPFVYSEDMANIGIAEEKEFTNVTILDHATQWFFRNPERR